MSFFYKIVNDQFCLHSLSCIVQEFVIFLVFGIIRLLFAGIRIVFVYFIVCRHYVKKLKEETNKYLGTAAHLKQNGGGCKVAVCLLVCFFFRPLFIVVKGNATHHHHIPVVTLKGSANTLLLLSCEGVPPGPSPISWHPFLR